jgi:hypothetical protein
MKLANGAGSDPNQTVGEGESLDRANPPFFDAVTKLDMMTDMVMGIVEQVDRHSDDFDLPYDDKTEFLDHVTALRIAARSLRSHYRHLWSKHVRAVDIGEIPTGFTGFNLIDLLDGTHSLEVVAVDAPGGRLAINRVSHEHAGGGDRIVLHVAEADK